MPVVPRDWWHPSAHLGLSLLLLLLLPPTLAIGPSSPAFTPVSPSPRPPLRLATLASSTATKDNRPPRVFIFGLGYVGERLAQSLLIASSGDSSLLGPDVKVEGTCRDGLKAQRLQQELGIRVWSWDGEEDGATEETRQAIRLALQDSTHVISTVGPGPVHDPILHTFHDDLSSSPSLRWLAYLSSTSVYGDRDGAWVNEDDEALPTTDKGRARLKAESQWASLVAPHRPIHIFRLAGIYGPGRSALDSLIKAGQDGPPYRYTPRNGGGDHGIISRIHVHDITRVVEAAMRLCPPMGTPGGVSVYNVADDHPASRHEVFTWAAQELNRPFQGGGGEGDSQLLPSPDLPTRVRGGSKRVANAKVKKEVLAPVFGPPGDLLYPNYMVGLPSCRPVK